MECMVRDDAGSVAADFSLRAKYKGGDKLYPNAINGWYAIVVLIYQTPHQ